MKEAFPVCSSPAYTTEDPPKLMVMEAVLEFEDGLLNLNVSVSPPLETVKGYTSLILFFFK